jgi:hypothetical protein
VVAEVYNDEIQNALEPFIYELVGMYSLLIFSRLLLMCDRSIVQGIHLRRAWYWAHEGACAAVLEKQREYCADEED